jgi:hypothetical protein
MYRGVVRVYEEVTKRGAEDGDPYPPSSPVEKELTRAVEQLRSVDDSLGSYKNGKSSQTDFPPRVYDDNMLLPPIGYAVPRIFVRSVAEAIEQGVVTYCQLLQTPDERRNAILFMLREIREFISNPRHLYFEVFEQTPVWYDYIRIAVFDCVTANQLGSADLYPPTTRVIVHNVNIPLYESAVVTEESVPHMPQVEISLIKYSSEGDGNQKNRIVGQSVIVPLDLFVKASHVIIMLENGEEREISYRAALVRKDTVEELDRLDGIEEGARG